MSWKKVFIKIVFVASILLLVPAIENSVIVHGSSITQSADNDDNNNNGGSGGYIPWGDGGNNSGTVPSNGTDNNATAGLNTNPASATTSNQTGNAGTSPQNANGYSKSASTGDDGNQNQANEGSSDQPSANTDSEPSDNHKSNTVTTLSKTKNSKDISKIGDEAQKKVDKINSAKLTPAQQRIVAQYKLTAPANIVKGLDQKRELNKPISTAHNLPAKIAKKVVKKVLIKKYGKKFVMKKLPKRIFKHLPKMIRHRVKYKTFRRGYKLMIDGAGKSIGKTAYKFLRQRNVPKWAAGAAKTVTQAVIDWLL